MSGSPTFALEAVACALLGLVLWIACAGIGFLIIPAPAADRDPDAGAAPASWHQRGIAACVGLGLLLVLGGIAVVLYLPWWLVTAPFVVVGLVLAGRDLARHGIPRPLGIAATVLAVGVVALVGVATVESVVGFRFPLHPWDDLRAYLPLAHRIVETNSLDDAWNARRLQTVGGFSFLQAMPVSIFGDQGLGVVETMLATVFLGGLFIANGLRTTWARVVSIAFIALIPLFWVPRINTTGVLFGTPLVVAMFAMTVELRSALRRDDRRAALRWAIGAGLVIAALMSVRPNLGLLGAAVVTAGAIVVGAPSIRARVEVLAVAAASSVVALLPWSIASLRSVDTPFYLLSPGNQVPEPVRLAPANGLSDLLQHSWDLVRSGPYLWVALIVLAVALVARKLLPDGWFAVIATVVTLLVVAATALRGYTMAEIAFVRYTSPMSEGLAVFLFCELLRSTDARSAARATGDRSWTIAVIGLTTTAVVVAVAYSGVGLALEYDTAPGGAALVRKAFANQLLPAPAQITTTPGLERAYRRALQHVDPDRTIAAVDRPYLIDYGRFDIPDMDLPGFTAPGADFPFLTGPGAKVARLRRAGFDTLLATEPTHDAALSPRQLVGMQRRRLPSYSPTARYYLDWENDLLAIENGAPDAVQRFGPLIVIDLARAGRDLARATGSGATGSTGP